MTTRAHDVASGAAHLVAMARGRSSRRAAARAGPRHRARRRHAGALNAITDVAGVRVGHVTLDQRRHVRTGVTAILPHGGNLFREKVPGAVFVGNAFGKLAGSTQVAGARHDRDADRADEHALGRHRARRRRALDDSRSPATRTCARSTALVGETNDGALNDIRGLPRHARSRHGGDRRRARAARSTKAPSAPAPARSRSAGRAASARRRGASRRRRTSGRSACSCRRTTAAG